MIFQYTHEWITGVSPHTGEPKTQTRRIALPEADGTGEFACEMISYPKGVKSVVRSKSAYDSWRTVWSVGKTYPVQPGRGQKAIARTEITDIRHGDVRDISDEDVRAEGFGSRLEFLETWVRMHDKDVFFCHPYIKDGNRYARDEHGELLIESTWNIHARGLKDGKRRKELVYSQSQATDGEVYDFLRTRPDDRYQAWVLDFKLVASSQTIPA